MKLYMHTAKAVRANSALMATPNDRVLLVVGKEEGRLVAWKCTLRPNGLEHPAFWTPGTTRYRPLPLTRAGIAKGDIKGMARNGAEPTAWFRPDSFYRQVTLADLTRIAKEMQMKTKTMIKPSAAVRRHNASIDKAIRESDAVIRQIDKDLANPANWETEDETRRRLARSRRR